MEGLVSALVVDSGVVRVDNVPLVIPQGYVLVKTLWARWGSIDEAVRRGLLPVDMPVVAGYTGVGVVVETSIGSNTSLAGRPVSLIRVSENYMPPVIGHGFISPYAVAPGDHLVTVQRDPGYVILFDSALACETLRALENKSTHSVLVLGSGIYGLLVAYLLHSAGIEYAVFVKKDSASYSVIRELGLATTQSLGALDSDAVVASSLDTLLVEEAVKKTETRILVLHPLIAYRGIPVRPLARSLELVGVAGGKEFAGCAMQLVKKTWRVLSSYMSFVKGLIPPPSEGLPALGVVYEVSSS